MQALNCSKIQSKMDKSAPNTYQRLTNQSLGKNINQNQYFYQNSVSDFSQNIKKYTFSSLSLLQIAQYIDNGQQIQHSQIKKDDDDIIYGFYDLYLSEGPKWKLIASKMGKEPSFVKNSFYSKIRKLHRKLVNIVKKVRPVQRLITYDALLRPLEASKLSHEPFFDYSEQILQLQLHIIKYLKKDPEHLDEKEGLQLIDHIHQFNSHTKSIKLDKHERKKFKKSGKNVDTQQNLRIQENNHMRDLKAEDNYSQSIRLMNFQEIQKLYEEKQLEKKEDILLSQFQEHNNQLKF